MTQNLKKFVKDILKEYKIYPSKGLGQNFLINQSILKRIIGAANLRKTDTVLEIGPGMGTLTQELAHIVRKVIAVEKDIRMCEILRKTLKDANNVKIIESDILKLPITRYSLPITASYKIVANLPYYIASPVIRKFLELKHKPREMILMVQKEVAQRICAKPPEMTILAVSAQFYAETKFLFSVSKKHFWPEPKVDGAVIKLVTGSKRQVTSIDKDLFFKIVRAGFSQPRKQLVNNLSKKLALYGVNGLKLDKEKVGLWLARNKINPSQRAETLGIKKWIRLTKSYIINQ